jgi:hypothetical protein
MMTVDRSPSIFRPRSNAPSTTSLPSFATWTNTPGPVGLGTRYREVVRLLPFVEGEIRAEVVCYEPPRRLGYHFSGLGMEGVLDYRFQVMAYGTWLEQHQVLRPRGMLRLLSPLIRVTFGRVAGRRLAVIKAWLESERGT